MNQNSTTRVLNAALVRVTLILMALAAFVLAAGAPACVVCP